MPRGSSRSEGGTLRESLSARRVPVLGLSTRTVSPIPFERGEADSPPLLLESCAMLHTELMRLERTALVEFSAYAIAVITGAMLPCK